MRNYTITSIWNIPIRINISLIVFLPVLAWLIGSGGQIQIYAGFIERYMGIALDVTALRTGSLPWVIGIIAAIGLFVSVTLHELGHSWVALRYGLEIESITLWILGGIAALGTIPREWNREFWIAIAGPITSILVAIACWASVLIVPRSFPVIQFILGWLAIVNLTLAVFNLLPAFPMDGGRILRAILARSRPYASATRIAGRIGVIFALLFAVLGVMSFNLILILLAVFIYGAATTESRTVLIDELLEGITVGDIMTRNPKTISAEATVTEFTDRMLRERQMIYPVEDATGDIVGIVSLDDLRQVRKEQRNSTHVSDVMRTPQRIGPTADAFDTLVLLNQTDVNAALVEENGILTGVLSEADYSNAFTIQQGFQSSITG